MKRRVLIVVLLLLTIALGFVRDYIFVSLNGFIESVNDAGGRLSLLKWVLTALFSLLYLLDTCVFLFVCFGDKKYVWLSLFSFALLFLTAFFASLISYCFFTFADVYPFIRAVMGVAQSPIIMMVLTVAAYLGTKTANRGE